MENIDLESEIPSSFHIDNIVRDSQPSLRGMSEIETVTPIDSRAMILGENGTRKEGIYKAVIALSRSIAGRTDLRGLISGVAESLRPIARFDHVGLILHDPN